MLGKTASVKQGERSEDKKRRDAIGLGCWQKEGRGEGEGGEAVMFGPGSDMSYVFHSLQ